MIALLLAQLVMPSPSVEPLSPPGMICMGECSDGPMVWRASPARGRLVVACDMRSDTCSDGRKITTTRATPVPCETSPGVWEMVPENTACISWRGLEAWAGTTSYLSYGAELDREPWRAGTLGTTVEALPQGYRISGVNSNSRVLQTIASPEAGVWTLSCIMRTSGSPNPRLRIYQEGASGGGFCNLDSSDEFSTYSCTQTITGTPTQLSIHVYSDVGHIDVQGCWLTRTDTPGRACWGGEAPVTCAADRHTISTEGWPTEAGEINVTYTPQGVGIGSAMYLAATSAGGAGQPSGFYLYRISASGALVFGLRRGDTTSAQATQDLAWENGRSYHVRVRWSPERAEIWRDGVRLRSWVPTIVPDSHPVTAFIGTNTIGTSPAQGSISSLRVRSFE